ncbi:Transketolase 1 [compost metagenome]
MAYGWQVLKADGHDADALRAATLQAKAETKKPTIIICKTIIGLGSPNKQGKEDCHGAPLGNDEIALTREALGWTEGPFEIPADVYAAWDAKAKGTASEAAWNELFAQYAAKYPTEAAELKRRLSGELPAEFLAQADAFIADTNAKAETIATRKASQNTLQAFGPLLPELLGGSADLAGSNLTLWKGCQGVQDNPAGNYVHYGVREFGMTAIANGVALHGGFIPYVATFLMFMEYARNAVRMSALMKQRVIHVYTHDSIGLGEDGPTHQPVEQIASLRGTPNLNTWRPCDTVEAAVSWKSALVRSEGPSALIFSRQNLPFQTRTDAQIANVAKGGYVLAEEKGALKAIIIATGSEVSLAMEAHAQLDGVRVVSMPCAEEFVKQDAAYREAVLPSNIRARVAVEAAHVDYWWKFVGLDGRVIGMTTYGESAPAKDLYQYFGITTEAVVAAVKELTA